MTAIGTRGGSIWVEHSGSGPALLFLAGLGYASWFWRDIAGSLSRSMTTLAIDARGTGRSSGVGAAISVADLAADACGVLDALGVDRAHVVGHSMGGYVALTLAAQRPDRVLTLTVAGSSGGGPKSIGVPQETLAAWSANRERPPQEFARRTMPLAFAPGWVEANPDRFERWLSERLRFPTSAVAWSAHYEAAASFLKAGIDLSLVRAPTLVIHGTADRIVPFENAVVMSRELPRVRFCSMKDRGHLLSLEDPSSFLAELTQHIRDQT
jgi:3-oxoadipate enol-lactonase